MQCATQLRESSLASCSPLSSSNARAERRAETIANDTAHSGNQLLEDLWEVELVLHRWLCLPRLQPLTNTCPPTQLGRRRELHPSPDYLQTNP